MSTYSTYYINQAKLSLKTQEDVLTQHEDLAEKARKSIKDLKKVIEALEGVR